MAWLWVPPVWGQESSHWRVYRQEDTQPEYPTMQGLHLKATSGGDTENEGEKGENKGGSNAEERGKSSANMSGIVVEKSRFFQPSPLKALHATQLPPPPPGPPAATSMHDPRKSSATASPKCLW